PTTPRSPTATPQAFTAAQTATAARTPASATSVEPTAAAEPTATPAPETSTTATTATAAEVAATSRRVRRMATAAKFTGTELLQFLRRTALLYSTDMSFRERSMTAPASLQPLMTSFLAMVDPPTT